MNKPIFKQGELIEPGEKNQFLFTCQYCHNLKSPTVYEKQVCLVSDNGIVKGVENSQTSGKIYYTLGKDECRMRSENLGLYKFRLCKGDNLQCYTHKKCLEFAKEKCQQYLDNDLKPRTVCCNVELNQGSIQLDPLEYQKETIKSDMKRLQNISYYHSGKMLCEKHNSVLDLVKVSNGQGTPICKFCFDELQYGKDNVQSLESYVLGLYTEIEGFYTKVAEDIRTTENNIQRLNAAINKIQTERGKLLGELKKQNDELVAQMDALLTQLNSENNQNVSKMEHKIQQQINQFNEMVKKLSVVEKTLTHHLEKIKEESDLCVHVFTDLEKEQELVTVLTSLEQQLQSDIVNVEEVVIAVKLQIEYLESALSQSIQIS